MMPSKVKVTVSLDSSLVSELEKAGRRSGKSRSRLMEEALHHWHRSQLEQALKEGYQAMATEDRAVAEQNLFAQILTVDKSRLLRRMGSLSSGRMDMVNSAIKVSLDVG